MSADLPVVAEIEAVIQADTSPLVQSLPVHDRHLKDFTRGTSSSRKASCNEKFKTLHTNPSQLTCFRDVFPRVVTNGAGPPGSPGVSPTRRGLVTVMDTSLAPRVSNYCVIIAQEAPIPHYCTILSGLQ